jgi:hypothetical protein
MADPLAPTVPGKPGVEPEEGALRRAAPALEPLDAAVARAKIEGALFGDAAPIKVGRYVLVERAGAGGFGVVWSAWDPELGRPVALKLASSGDAGARARARDEGRALAKLSHPNVVPIYDVLEVDEGVFLVMELVNGKTLRAIAEAATPLEMVRAYRQAGEGLAAAHAAGLIHRDFKPDNAIHGADGRVRVLDFGLARSAGETHDLAGTPRYMAPEQRAGKPLTAAIDQYALCASLREAIEKRVPRWLEPILARGTAEDPGARFPSMEALLEALARDPATRWRRRALVGGGVVAIGAVIAAFTLGRAGREAITCDGGAESIAQALPRDRIAAHLRSLTTAYAREATTPVLAGLDAYAASLQSVNKTSCEAHLGGAISSELFDRRIGCLARRRSALATLGELAGTAKPDELSHLMTALRELPDLATCEDDDALVSTVEPPPRWKVPEATAIASLIARADVERDGFRLAAAARDADLAITRARTLGYRPLIARALISRGRVGIDALAEDRGAPQFAAAIQEAIAAGDDRLAVEAWARHAWAFATTRGPAKATDGQVLIEAMLEKLGDRARFERALLQLNLANVALARGDRETARAAFIQGREAITTGGAIELTAILAGLMLVTDGPEREAVAADLIARRTRLVGPNHPLTLGARSTAASMLADPETARASLEAVCRELERFHPTLGADIAECAYESTWLALVAGDREATRSAATRLLGTETTGGAPPQTGLARAALQVVDGTDAAAAFVALQVAEEKEAPAWWHDFYIADAAIGEAVARRGDAAGARKALDKAERLYTRIEKALPAPVKARRLAVLRALRD